MTDEFASSKQASEEELLRWMENYGPVLTGLCAALLGDAQQAQDVVQETFIRAYQNRGRFRGERETSEKAWLTRIAVNLCRDLQRSRWFRFVDRRVSVDELTTVAPEASEEEKTIYEAVRSLPAREKEILLLVYYQDMSAEEIARALHVTASSVYRRKNRALQALRKKLEGWGFRG